MSNISEWLEQRGFGKYVEAFEAEEISLATLPHLTDEMLKDLGLAMGPRAELLAAARDFTSQGVSSHDVAPRSEGSQVSRDAERRQITVMFCDLVGSTALAETLDPEDLRVLMGRYQEGAGQVIVRYDGHVAQFLGDGIMAYFGWPNAHEDDAERAVRAALDIINVVEHPVRIGIATGPVVVGNSDGTEPELAVGETPNLASRLQGLAAEDQIVISPGTRRLVGATFELAELGAQVLRGIAEPVSAFRVDGLATTEGRFEARSQQLTPFVGRDGEMAMLMERWASVKEGEGQVVLLEGEPGIGKSRITHVLCERLLDEPHIRLRYQCSPYNANSAFHPIIGQLECAAGFKRDDSPEEKLDKLETLLAQSAEDLPSVAPLIAAMLSLPLDRYPPLNLSPQRQKENTVAALADQVTALAARQPLLMLFEDAHWCDPTTLETLTAVLGQIETVPVLLLITYRPEFDPPWSAGGHVTALTLTRLSRRLGADLVAKVTGGKTLPDEVLAQIVAKTDGVPLFVEELTKTVLEAGFLHEQDDNYALDGPLPPLAIPSTLQDSLMARLDKATPMKEVAQIGAAIGREFSHQLLAALSPLSNQDLCAAIEKLIASELVHRFGTPPDAAYLFKHALVRDAAYESLLIRERQQLHAKIAAAIDEFSPSTKIQQPEMLAQHHSKSGNAKEAVQLWKAAAKLSIERSAHLEAIRFIDNALTNLTLLPDNTLRASEELELIALQLGPLLPVTGYGSTSARRKTSRALELCQITGDREALLPVLYSQWVAQLSKSAIPRLTELSEQFLELALAAQSDSATVVGYRIQATSQLMRGDAKLSLDSARRSWGLCAGKNYGSVASLYGQDLKVQCLTWLAAAEALHGNLRHAIDHADEAIKYARQLNHANSLAYALNAVGVWFHAIMRDSEKMHLFGSELLNFAQENGLSSWSAIARPFLDIVLDCSPLESKAEKAEKSLETWRLEFGSNFLVPHMLCHVAEAHMTEGSLKRSHQLLIEAKKLISDTGEAYWEAEVFRIRGRLAELIGPVDSNEPEKHYERAIAKAREKHQKLLEIRAVCDLSRRLKSQDARKEAYELLAPVFGYFTEGFGSADLVEAKTLLDELR